MNRRKMAAEYQAELGHTGGVVIMFNGEFCKRDRLYPHPSAALIYYQKNRLRIEKLARNQGNIERYLQPELEFEGGE